MPGRFIGYRGARDSEWSWERTEEVSESRDGPRWLRTALISTAFVTGIAAFAFGVFLVVTNDNGNAAPPIVSGSPSASATPTPTAESTATPTQPITPTPAPTRTDPPIATATPTPSPTPGPNYVVEFASWSNPEDAWITPSHSESTSDYEEGDMVPFLLRIDNTEVGTTYRIGITYDCVSGDEPAFDYVGGAESAIAEAVLTSPGPGREVPDSTLLAPDDTSISFDDDERGAFRAWGAVFSAAGGPTPGTDCTDAKTVSMSLVAQDDTVYLVWTGHLASSADWGAGNGASGATPFSISIDINGGEIERDLTMQSGSVAP